MNNAEDKIYCGIDVSKLHLDAFIRGTVVRFENTTKGVGALAKRAGKVHYVFESSGGYERMAAWRMMTTGYDVSVVNPGRVREYAKSMGQFAKTDGIDARIITEFAQAAIPKLAEMPTKQQRRLTTIVERRDQLVKMRVAEFNRLDSAGEDEMRKLIKMHVKWLDRQIEKLDEQIDCIILEDPEMRRKAKRIQSIKGLGKFCAATLLVHMPEIGSLSKKEVAALAGLAPYNRDSGAYQGKRHVFGGRKDLRASLYMGALSASQCNPHLKAFYTRLIEENHCPKKVALTAVMRKLIIAANSAIKNPEFGT
jgi:transposase